MEVAHFEVLRNGGFTPEEAVGRRQVWREVAVICSADGTYPELVPPWRQHQTAAPDARAARGSACRGIQRSTSEPAWTTSHPRQGELL
ncbi:MAG: hypothetical protein ACLUEQ_10460 [Cloacibacillus evryensis]